MRRARSSRSRRRPRSDVTSPRRASAAWTTSNSLRTLRMSITTADVSGASSDLQRGSPHRRGCRAGGGRPIASGGVSASAESGAPAVEVTDLVVRYGELTAVDGISFTARAGAITALLGPNGAGKTTTVETLEGYRRPSTGAVRVLGLDPVADHASLVGRIGVMLQRGGVAPGIRPAGGAAALRVVLRRPRRSRGAAGPRGPRRAAPIGLATPLGRGAATPVARAGAHRPAGGRLPRRAHLRRRPDRSTGGARRDGRAARAGRLRARDHPRPRRGRADGRPRDHHRSRSAVGRGVTHHAHHQRTGRRDPLRRARPGSTWQRWPTA